MIGEWGASRLDTESQDGRSQSSSVPGEEKQVVIWLLDLLIKEHDVAAEIPKAAKRKETSLHQGKSRGFSMSLWRGSERECNQSMSWEMHEELGQWEVGRKGGTKTSRKGDMKKEERVHTGGRRCERKMENVGCRGPGREQGRSEGGCQGGEAQREIRGKPGEGGGGA